MKLLFVSISLICLNSFTSSFYDIKFEALDGTIVKASSYQGKKVVIAVVSANTSSLTLVRYLDSVQRVNNSIQVVAIPTGDFNGDVNVQSLKALKKTITILVTTPLKVKKSNGSLQHPLFVWLTQTEENKHFNLDVAGEGQVFIVSSKGTLYSVLNKEVPVNVLGKVINQPFTE
jgi:glutathione peroxidase-family protein